jgi:hypothetical protein
LGECARDDIVKLFEPIIETGERPALQLSDFLAAIARPPGDKWVKFSWSLSFY